jgi:transglutaminase-like putative cysteine protease
MAVKGVRMKHLAKTGCILLIAFQLLVLSCKTKGDLFTSFTEQSSTYESAWQKYSRDYTGEGGITAGTKNVKPYITGRPHPRAGQVPKALLKAVKDNPEEQLENLVAFLTDGIEDPFVKVKIIHDWMIYNINYDYKAYDTGNIPRQSASATLKTGKAVCWGYAALFQIMCEMAGVPCQLIEGYGRGVNYDPASSREQIAANHAWNAVRIGDGWYLLDVTWDSNSLEQLGEYSESWLFSPPEAVVFSHFPEKSVWQLLAPAVTSRKFLSYASFDPDFFMILKGIPEPLLKEYKVQGEFSFTLPRLEDGYELDFSFVEADLYDEISKKALEEGKGSYEISRAKVYRRISMNTWDDRITVDMLFPKKIAYYLMFNWRKDTGGETLEKSYTQCGVIRFVNSRVLDHGFPLRDDMVSNVIEPKYDPLHYGTKQRFHFFAPGIDKVYIKDSKKRWEFPAINKKGEFLFTYQILQKKDYKTYFPGEKHEFTDLKIQYAPPRRGTIPERF